MAKISVEAYDGWGVRVYWDHTSCCNTYARENYIHMEGNHAFFKALAMQLVYFAGNDFNLPTGTHVHYDEAFGHRYLGPELVVEVIPDKESALNLDASESLIIHVDVPSNLNELFGSWNAEAEITVTYDASVCLLANRQGLMFIATALLFLLENNNTEIFIPCKDECLDGWRGQGLAFSLIDNV